MCAFGTPMFLSLVRNFPAHFQTRPNIWRCNLRMKASSRMDLGRDVLSHCMTSTIFSCSRRLSSSRVVTWVGISPSASCGSSGVVLAVRVSLMHSVPERFRYLVQQGRGGGFRGLADLVLRQGLIFQRHEIGRAS